MMPHSIPLPGEPVRGSASGRPVMALFDLLGRAWAMGVVWQLNDGRCTFRELQERCGGVSPSLLSKRLKELRATGLVEHDGTGYGLTTLGSELFDQLNQLGNWSKHWAASLASADGEGGASCR